MASENDLTGRVGLDTTAFKTGISDLNSSIKSIETSFRASAAVMDNWSGNTAGLQGRVDSLSEKLTLQKQKLSTLNEEYQKTVQAQGADSTAAQSLANQMYSTEKSINSTENDLKKYSDQLKNVKDKSEGLTFKKFNDGLAGTSEAASKALKGITMFVGGAVAALGGLLGSSVKSADELQKLSDVTGFTAEQLQVMKYQGSALGVELDTMTGAQSKLIKAMAAASTGKSGPNAQAKAFQDLGIQVRDSSGHLRDSNTVFNEAITKLGGVKNETDRDALAMQLFGKSAMNLNPLIKAGGTELQNMADEAKKNGAIMSNDAVAGLDNFGDSIDALKLSVQGAIGSAFGKLSPQLNDLTDKIKGLDLSKVTEGISFALDHLPQIGTAIAGVTGAVVAWKVAAVAANVVSGISNAMMAVQTLHAGGMAAAHAALSTATGNTAIAQLALNAAWLANPVTLIVIAIAALVTAFVLLWKNCEGFRNFFIGMWAGIKSAASAIGVWFSGPFVQFFQSAGNGIKSFFTGIPGFFTGIWNGIKSAALAAWNGITAVILAVVSPLVNGVLNLWNSMKGGIQTAFDGIKNIAQGAWEIIKNVIMAPVLIICDLVTGNFGQIGPDLDKIWGNIKAGAETVWNGIKEFFSGTLEAIKGFFTTEWNGIKTLGENVWNGLKDFFTGLWAGIKNTAVNAWNEIKDFFAQFWANEIQGWKNIINGLLDFFKNLPANFMSAIRAIGDAIIHGFDSAISFIKNLPSEALQWGKDIINGIVDGIKSAAHAVGDAVKGVAQDIRKFLHFSVPDEGPLVDFQTWMPDFMAGLARGIEANKYKVANAMRGLAADMSVSVPVSPAYAGGYSTPTAPVAGATYNFYQNNYSPKPIGPAETARQTRNLLQQARLTSRRH